MNTEPLSKEIYNEAIELGVTNIILQFEGGHDEGYLYVSLAHKHKFSNLDKNLNKSQKQTLEKINAFEAKVEEWAWSVYHYSGAGDGQAYGDNIEYDLKNKTVSTQEWYTSQQYNYGDKEELQLESLGNE